MLYIFTNVIAAVGCLLILVFSLMMERFTIVWLNTKHLTITAMIVTINVVLTNLVSYNLPVMPGGIKIDLGAWLIFLLGSILGPVVGWIGAVTCDSIGSIINVGGTYHAGFMFDKSLLALFGSFVFVYKKNNHILLKVVLMYAIGLFLESLILNPIWLYSSGWSKAVYASELIRLAKYPICLLIYSFFVVSSLQAIKYILFSWKSTIQVWCLKNDSLSYSLFSNKKIKETAVKEQKENE